MSIKVKIHIGPWKTGSTTLQKFCASNRELLSKSGILYPIGNCDYQAHHEIPHLLNGTVSRLQSKHPKFNLSMDQILESYKVEMSHRDLTELWLSSEVFAESDSTDYRKFKDEACLILSGRHNIQIFSL
jgi:hypothetical protein